MLRFIRKSSVIKNVHLVKKAKLPVTIALGFVAKTVYTKKTFADAQFLVRQPSIIPPITVDKKVDIISTIWSCYESILHWFDLLFRAVVVGGIYSPSIVALPLLLTQSDKLRDMWWAITRYCLSNGGPCSIKFAQWLSTRPDLFPVHVCKQLQQLQSTTALPNWTDIEPILVKYYGENYAERIEIEMSEKDNNKTPLIVGSGCVAYVLKGKLLKFVTDADGNKTDQMVAIKITHPHVGRVIRSDIELLRFVSGFLEYWIPSIKNISLADSVEEFSTLMNRQINMETEAHSLDKFRVNFNIDVPPAEELKLSFFEKMTILFDKLSQKITNTNVHNVQNEVTFPQPVWEFTNSDILVERFERGVLMHEMMKYSDTPTKRKLAQIGLDAIFKMIFIDNFIHADLHPGNIICLKQHDSMSDDIEIPSLTDLDRLVSAEEQRSMVEQYSVKRSGKLQLSFIDAGLVVSLEPTDRLNFLDLFKAIITNDGFNVGQLMIERSRGPMTVINPTEFCCELKTIVNDVHNTGLTLGKVGINSLLQKVLILCYQHQVKLESRFVSVIVAIGVLEGMGRQLDPEVDILKKVTPYALRAAVFQKP